MNTFISWSGSRSQEVASALHDWLPNVIQVINPFMSSEDIRKGKPWFNEITDKLESTRCGIICLTPENREEPWILFEAGAISKTLGESYVCPYLFGMNKAEVEPPISHFQATEATREDTFKLLKTLNQALESSLGEEQLEKTFAIWWPELEDKLKQVKTPSEPTPPRRNDRQLLEEILDIVRSLSRQEEERQFSREFISKGINLFGDAFAKNILTRTMKTKNKGVKPVTSLAEAIEEYSDVGEGANSSLTLIPPSLSDPDPDIGETM